jgi:hypothetical protein
VGGISAECLSLRVVLHHLARCLSLWPIVGQEERRLLASQPAHDDLPNLPLMVAQLRLFIHIKDGPFLIFGLSHLTALPGRRRNGCEPAQHTAAAPTNRDKADLALFQGVQLGVGGHPTVEQQTRRVVPPLGFPVLGKANRHLVRLVAQHVGRSVAHDSPLRFLCDENHDRHAGSVPFRQPVLLQVGVVAAKRDGVKIQIETVRSFPQRCLAQQGVDEAFAHGSLRSVGIVRGESGLGQHVQAAEQPGSLIVTQVIDVADTPFAEQLAAQQSQDCLQGGDGGRTRPASLLHGGGKIQHQQQRHKQEKPGDLALHPPAWLEGAQPGISRGRDLGAILGDSDALDLPATGRLDIDQPMPCKDARKVGLADRMALLVQTLLDLSQGQPLLAKADDVLQEGVALGGSLPPWSIDHEELLKIGVVGKVADDSADGVGVQGEAFGQLLGRRLVEVVGLTDLVVALSHEGGGTEQVGQLCGTSHARWVVNEQGRSAQRRTRRKGPTGVLMKG